MKKTKLNDLQLLTNNKVRNKTKFVTYNNKANEITKNSANQRNAMRIQARAIANALALKAYHQNSEWHTYFYLWELLEQNALERFDKDLKHELKQYSQKQHSVLCLLMMELELERTLMFNAAAPQTIPKVFELFDKMDDALNLWRENNALRKQTFLAYAQSSGILPQKKVISVPEPKNVLQQINALRVRAFENQNVHEKINLLKQINDLCASVNTQLFKREQAATCVNLATYCMLVSDFEQSYTFYNKAIELKKYLRPAHFNSLQFNYVSLCLRNQKFDVAYAAMLVSDQSIQTNKSLTFKWQLLKSMCYALVGKEKDIKSILPNTPQKKEINDLVYFYCIWCIYFIKMQKYETALKMLETAKRACQRKQKPESLFVFVNITHKYVLLCLTYKPRVAAKKMLSSVNQINFDSLRAGNILPLVWFKQHLTSYDTL